MDGIVTGLLLFIQHIPPVCTEDFLQDRFSSAALLGFAALFLLAAVFVSYKWKQSKGDDESCDAGGREGDDSRQENRTETTAVPQHGNQPISPEEKTPSRKPQEINSPQAVCSPSLKHLVALKRIQRLEDQLTESQVRQGMSKYLPRAARPGLEERGLKPDEELKQTRAELQEFTEVNRQQKEKLQKNLLALEELKATQIKMESKMIEARDLHRQLDHLRFLSKFMAEKEEQLEKQLADLRDQHQQELHEERQRRKEVEEQLEALRKELEIAKVRFYKLVYFVFSLIKISAEFSDSVFPQRKTIGAEDFKCAKENWIQTEI
ncbi:transcript variant X2 [Nothobranchius furzeri]|uniref:Transcript variant X1 n=1 Tax=Nothobranchius furzeri TaxID=105023 RepID=A0A9D2YZZ2_NOTFU|nr:transcript variant X1 [Nothobranchius furzeri]KAF7229767.1 transcript variant X2 [Nothobranchius furzeri]